MQINWGNVTPTREQRRRAEARIEPIVVHVRGAACHAVPTLSVERRPWGFAASVYAADRELLVRGPDLETVVDRAAETLGARI